jgi:hypothetical protein
VICFIQHSQSDGVFGADTYEREAFNTAWHFVLGRGGFGIMMGIGGVNIGGI